MLKTKFGKSHAGDPAAEEALMARRALVGTIALSVVNFGRLALQLLVLPILARILGPASFGIVSLAMPFILFANMLSDAGMGNALIRRNNPSREVESTVFWLSVGVGAVTALLICALSGTAEKILRQPGLAVILMAMSPILLLSSTLSVANARISRTRRFSLFAVGDVISTVSSSAAAIAAALHGWGAWSLVLQQLVLWTVKSAWILPMSRFRPILVCRPSIAKDLLAFGLHSVGADIADFTGKNVPALVIGSALGVVAVGHYSMAYQLVRIPDIVLSGPLFLATFTALSALMATEQHANAAQLSMRTMRMVVVVLAPVFCGLALIADLLISTLLGARWISAGPVLALLSPAGFFICLYSLCGALLMGLGRPDLQFRLSGVCGAGMLIGALIGERFGLAGATIGVSLGASFAFPLYLVTLSRQLQVKPAVMLANIVRPLVAAAVMAAAVVGLRTQIAHLNETLQLVACIALGAVVFTGALSLTSGRQVLDDIRSLLPGKRALRGELGTA